MFSWLEVRFRIESKYIQKYGPLFRCEIRLQQRRQTTISSCHGQEPELGISITLAMEMGAIQHYYWMKIFEIAIEVAVTLYLDKWSTFLLFYESCLL